MSFHLVGWRWRAPDGRESGVYVQEQDAKAGAVWQALAEMRKGSTVTSVDLVEQLWRSLEGKGWQIVKAGS